MVTSNCKDPSSPLIGILTFEMASTMSSLLSLHHMLSDPMILKLRSDIMRSQGVAYLNSTAQSILIKQCCAELITDLDRAAEFMSRLSHRCQSPFSTGFGRIFTGLKSGSINPARLGIKLAVKSIDRRFKKLDKHVRTASKLHDEMEKLSELEAMEMKRFGRLSGPLLKEMKHISTAHLDVKSQAQKVNKLKDGSLWNQTYDKVIGLMTLACCSLLVRVCAVFGPFVPGLPRIITDEERSGLFFSRIRVHPRSGPLERRSGCKETPLWKSCPIPSAEESDIVTSWRGMLEAEAGTVGGSGLALRYANIIVLAENMMAGEKLEVGEREELYGLMPDELNRRVKGKLRRWRREGGEPDRRLARGWKEGVWRILGWLGPVARDTLRWEMERSMDPKLRFEGRRRGGTYLMQTLHFADKVKTEAAIVEVLVGLSMVCWHNDWRLMK